MLRFFNTNAQFYCSSDRSTGFRGKRIQYFILATTQWNNTRYFPFFISESVPEECEVNIVTRFYEIYLRWGSDFYPFETENPESKSGNGPKAMTMNVKAQYDSVQQYRTSLRKMFPDFPI